MNNVNLFTGIVKYGTKHLPQEIKFLRGKQNINVQSIIDDVCNVRKTEFLDALDDLELHKEYFGQRRMQIYKAFTGQDVQETADTFYRSCALKELATINDRNEFIRNLEKVINSKDSKELYELLSVVSKSDFAQDPYVVKIIKKKFSAYL